MRVLLVLGTSAGGVGRHVDGLAHGLAVRGHEVVVAGPAASLPTEIPGVRTLSVAISDRPHPLADARSVQALRRALRPADVVHAHGLRAAALACLAATRSGVPVVVTLHNAAPTTRATKAVYAVLERLVARRARVVLGVSRDLVERAAGLGARRTGVAVVPAPLPRTPARPVGEIRSELGVAESTALVVCVARLAPQKGLGTLLGAAALLRDLPVLVVVAGDGPLEQALRERVARDALPVRLLGRRDDVPDLLAAADVVVSSSRWEGQPIGLQEALQAGAAIVATDAGGTRDTLHGAGRLVPVGDVRALAAGIRAVVTDPAARAALEARSRDAAADLPSGEDAVDAALSVYRDARRH
ncbi:putative glycosyl transferase [Nostocoides japonicum T1-X7]|uniref:D-inositol 3-phosphate glycosyltransferase n=1 Tax=Nostocoides japonicum T1-X7 TaxID=1194083 RepID=A0A077M7D2_9MICO|nr:glycosyltransferase family 4 protein [Tetrasphaera japonica]CCH79965.1 putative glycosyl transferase [Tetrasphaera japonica T1-X7]